MPATTPEAILKELEEADASYVAKLETTIEALEPVARALQEAKDRLARVRGTTHTPAPPAGRRASSSRNGTSSRSGTRSEQILSMVAEHPGSSISELAKGIGIADSYVSTVVKKMEGDGKVHRERVEGQRAEGVFPGPDLEARTRELEAASRS